MNNDRSEYKANPVLISIETSGGVSVSGDVSTSGDFIGRDKIVHGDEIHGDKLIGDKITGTIGAGTQYLAVGREIAQVFITNDEYTSPSIDPAILRAAQAQLDCLPLDYVPSIAPLPSGSRLPWSPNPSFAGREAEFSALAAALKDSNTTTIEQTAVATGFGGIGKTQLAVEFAYRYGQYFAGGVFWLSFTDAAAIPSEIAACGAALNLRPDYAMLKLDEQVQLVLSVWQSPLPRLLIFDNCSDPALLVQWRPTTGGSRLLVTSRRTSWSSIQSLKYLRLGLLSRPASIALLKKLLSSSIDMPEVVDDPVNNPATLDALAAELGDLPLALHLAGSYLARYRYTVSIETYLAQLRNPDQLLYRLLKIGEMSPLAHEQHVARTFVFSYNQLDPTNRLDALAIMILTRAACFVPGEPISRPLLFATIDQPPNAYPSLALDALQHLNDLGLIEIEADYSALRLHRLLARFVHEAAGHTFATAQSAVETSLINEVNHFITPTAEDLHLPWLNHLRYITDAAQTRLDLRAAELCNATGLQFCTIGEYTIARPYYERALSINRIVLGDQHPDTAQSLTNLGYLLSAQGDLNAARPYYEQALAIRQAALGDQHPDIAQSLTNLGILLYDEGDFSTAHAYLEQALAIRQAALGDQHPDTAQSLNNLGYLLQAQGNLSAAYPYYEQALAIYNSVLGDHPDTAASLTNLGYVLLAQGDFAAAGLYYRQALTIGREIGDHRSEGIALGNLGNVYRKLGQVEQAIQCYMQALVISREIGDRSSEGAWLGNLGNVYRKLGQVEQAIQCYTQALVISREIGDTHSTIHHLIDLGATYRDLGQIEQARQVWEEAVSIDEQFKSPVTATVRAQLNALAKI